MHRFSDSLSSATFKKTVSHALRLSHADRHKASQPEVTARLDAFCSIRSQAGWKDLYWAERCWKWFLKTYWCLAWCNFVDCQNGLSSGWFQRPTPVKMGTAWPWEANYGDDTTVVDRLQMACRAEIIRLVKLYWEHGSVLDGSVIHLASLLPALARRSEGQQALEKLALMTAAELERFLVGPTCDAQFRALLENYLVAGRGYKSPSQRGILRSRSAAPGLGGVRRAESATLVAGPLNCCAFLLPWDVPKPRVRRRAAPTAAWWWSELLLSPWWPQQLRLGMWNLTAWRRWWRTRCPSPGVGRRVAAAVPPAVLPVAGRCPTAVRPAVVGGAVPALQWSWRKHPKPQHGWSCLFNHWSRRMLWPPLWATWNGMNGMNEWKAKFPWHLCLQVPAEGGISNEPLWQHLSQKGTSLEVLPLQSQPGSNCSNLRPVTLSFRSVKLHVARQLRTLYRACFFLARIFIFDIWAPESWMDINVHVVSFCQNHV